MRHIVIIMESIDMIETVCTEALPKIDSVFLSPRFTQLSLPSLTYRNTIGSHLLVLFCLFATKLTWFRGNYISRVGWTFLSFQIDKTIILSISII